MTWVFINFIDISAEVVQIFELLPILLYCLGGQSAQQTVLLLFSQADNQSDRLFGLLFQLLLLTHSL